MLISEGASAPINLTIQHVQAMTDGQFFLDHLALLRTVAAEPYCRRCHVLGLDASVSVTRKDENTNDFRCAHTHGWVKRDEPLELQPLLTALGWDMRCTRCKGLLDAANAVEDTTFLVTCPCRVRAFKNPLAKKDASASQLSALAKLGRP